MKMRSTVLCALLSVTTLTFPAWSGEIDPTNPPEGTFFDDWYAVMLGGQKAGYMHASSTRKADKIKTATEMQFEMGRAGTSVKIGVTSATYAEIDGTPLGFATETDMSQMRMSIRGKIADGKIKLISEQMGNKTENTIDYPSGALMPWALFLFQYEKGYAPGTEYAVEVYDPTTNQNSGLDMHISVGQKETIDLFGQKVEAIRVNSILDSGMGKIRSTSHIDDTGTPYTVSMEMMGMEIRMVKCAKDFALQPSGPVEIFVKTLVRPNVSIDRKRANLVKYKLEVVGSESSLPKLPNTELQTPSQVTDRSAVLTVRRIDPRTLADAKPCQPSEQLAPYLAASPMLNWKDPAVAQMAREAVGDEKNVYKQCDLLRRHVTEAIVIKNLSVGFASASEVCKTHQGDCSEHGVLLAALGRALGIPSRVVSGLVYVPIFGVENDVFGFHMWTQFYIDGKWIDFDAAQNETDCNPTHIAISVSPLDEITASDMAFPLLEVISKLKIEVLEAEPPDALKPS